MSYTLAQPRGNVHVRQPNDEVYAPFLAGDAEDPYRTNTTRVLWYQEFKKRRMAQSYHG